MDIVDQNSNNNETRLSRFVLEGGVELLIDTVTGEAFSSISAYARMSGLSKQAISQRLKGVNQTELKMTEIETPGGLQGVKLLTEDLISEWLPKDNPVLTKQLLKFGTRGFLHEMAGFKVSSSAVVSTPPASNLEIAKCMIAELEKHEARLSAIELENIELKKQLFEQKHEVEAIAMETEANTCELERFKNGHGFFFSIAGWCANQGLKKSLGWMNSQGKKATALCRLKGITPEKVNDPRWGKVNTYPDSVLMELTW